MILLTFNILNNTNLLNKKAYLEEDELLGITEKNTASILRILENQRVLATFFVEITLVTPLLPLLKKITGKGHEIALYNASSGLSEITEAKLNAENFTEKAIKGIRQKDVTLSVQELKESAFSYLSNIENADILFPLKRLQRSTQISEEGGMRLIPESISPYSQIPYNDFVFQILPLKIYENMVLETIKKEDFVLIYLNSWQFTDFQKFNFVLPFYRKYNSGRKMEDKLNDFLVWMNENELAFSRLKDFIF